MFGSPRVEAAHPGDMIGSDGDAVRRGRLILKDDAIEQIDEEALLDAGLAIRRALETAGEPLRVMVEYAGQRALDELGTY
ncbi:hypothetical protein MKK75_24245 [Methylobacterium sp. J-030]|uniref:hypothetical protein n=1 Tax=Methylobacterium sp. J-030 TaxID=2836627 RepID=UPI001FB97241|nr:hypothetical protein [Methylobacterium sp. J-030]MCJ2071871.1 hypothetical protein [Methylobacterium sp. J-030]